jgi:hypothetical protein
MLKGWIPWNDIGWFALGVVALAVVLRIRSADWSPRECHREYQESERLRKARRRRYRERRLCTAGDRAAVATSKFSLDGR